MNSLYKKKSYRHYKVGYILKQRERDWIAFIYSYKTDDLISFHAETRRKAESQLLEWFYEQVDQNKIEDYIFEGYNIDLDYPQIMKEDLSGEIVTLFHVSASSNTESIIKHGLIPNFVPTKEVQYASRVMDTVKPKEIPTWVRREYAIYARPYITNYLLGNEQPNRALFAIKAERKWCWMGSEGLGGFCMFDEWTDEEANIKRAKQEGKRYWKNSCHFDEYIEKTERFKRIDRYYGLTEVLICHPVPPSTVEYLGCWDDKGCFHSNAKFVEYVKEEFMENFMDIVNKYHYASKARE